ncbi:MAG TPA: hypothetical protein PLF42_11170 [Anaerolineales bacterium]|nr:hypothetical protein [Anaerolineales bacterium]
MTEGITFTPSPVLYGAIGLIIGLILGWVIGFFDSKNRADKKIQAAEKNAEIKIQEAENKIRMAQGQIASAPQVSVQDDPGLLRLKHDHTLEMDGSPVTGALTPDKKKRLIDLLTLIRPYLEGRVTGQTPPPTPPMPVSTSRPVSSPKPVSRPSVPEPVQPVQPTLASAFSAPKKKDEKIAAPLSIVGQIDSVLQARLVGTPLAGKGLQKFASVDEVTDETVKAAIRAAIAEWEEKFTPGM